MKTKRAHRKLADWTALLGFALVCSSSPAAIVPTNNVPEPPPVSPREFFNAGSRQLAQGKLREAEASLQTVLGSQIEGLQPPALYNLGHVRFAQGLEELKKGPAAGPTLARGKTAADAAEEALQSVEDALAGSELQKMVASYMHGRGARRELKAAMKAVRQAMDAHGATLARWQRASGDFKSVIELNPGDADAQANADVVDRSIARLVDRLQQLQQMANAMGRKNSDLGTKLKQLKGRIPEPDMPPGAAGDEEEEEDQPMGNPPGEKEGVGKQGEETSMSPEQAGWMLEGFKLDSERRLPMGQGDTAEPKNRSRKPW
jgi:hypothetical protein